MQTQLLGPMCHHLNWLQIWPPDGATCIDHKFSHQVALLASVAILATGWGHLHQLKIGPPCDTICICSKFGHQVAPLALVPNLAIRWRHLQMFQIWPPGCVTLPWITLLASSVSIELVSSSATVTSVKSQQPSVVTDGYLDL